MFESFNVARLRSTFRLGVLALPCAAAVSAGAQEMSAEAIERAKKVFAGTCVTCHTSGVAGAPNLGDKAAWEPRLKGGKEALYKSALKGKKAMPPKGGHFDLPDEDVKLAVDFMMMSAR